MEQIKVYTVDEATQMISVLTPLVEAAQEKQKRAVALEAQVDALELIAGAKSDKSTHELNHLIKQHHEEVANFYAVMDQIHSHGCFLKDVDMGLIDFYSVIDGKVVYLCWKLGEDKINFWHHVGKGFSSRKPLDESPLDSSES